MSFSAEIAALQAETEAERASIKALRESFEQSADESIATTVQDLEDKYLATTGESVEQIESNLSKAVDVVAALMDMQSQGNRIIEAVGNRAVAKDYRTNARNKSFAGWIWDFLGLVIGGLSLLLLLWHLFDTEPAETDTSLALTRLAVSVAGVGLAALCFRRGRDNHSESRRSKRADIRLSTVGGFVAQQDQVFKDALVQAMADRIYLQDIVESPDPYDEDLMDKAIEKLHERRKAAAEAEDDEEEG